VAPSVGTLGLFAIAAYPADTGTDHAKAARPSFTVQRGMRDEIMTDAR
jgi:hypothetical protein